MSVVTAVSYNPNEVSNTFHDFIGRAEEPGKPNRSILWFAFKRIFFMGKANQETYNLLKTLNRVLEHDQMVRVFNQYFPNQNKEKTTYDNLEQFQAYILLVIKKLNNEYKRLLTESSKAKNEKRPRAARLASQQAKEVNKVLLEFKKHHNRWARRYQLRERVKLSEIIFDDEQKKYVDSSKNHEDNQQLKRMSNYGIEQLAILGRGTDDEKKQELDRMEKRNFKINSKPIGKAITVLVAAGCGFLVFYGLIMNLAFPLLPAALIAAGVFVINMRIFYEDTVKFFKFKNSLEVLRAFLFGADYVKAKSLVIKNEHPVQTGILMFFSLAAGACFGLATGVAVVESLKALFPLLPFGFILSVGVLIASVTLISFNGLFSTILRKYLNKLKNFSLSKKWKDFKNEWEEISSEELSPDLNARQRLAAQIDFVTKTFFQIIAWPLVIGGSIMAVISILGALQPDVARFLLFTIPSLASSTANWISVGLVASALIPEWLFGFMTMRSLFNMVIDLSCKIITAPAKIVVNLIDSPSKTKDKFKKYFAQKSQEIVTFFKRFRCDPWKTVGMLFGKGEAVGLMSSCGLDAFGNSAYAAGGTRAMQVLFKMPQDVACSVTRFTGLVASLGASTTYCRYANDMKPATKISVKKAEDYVKNEEDNSDVREESVFSFFSSRDYNNQVARSDYFISSKGKSEKPEHQSCKGKDFIERAEIKQAERIKTY